MKSNAVMSGSLEDSKSKEVSGEPPGVEKVHLSKEINSVRRKAKVLQADLDTLIRDISELSQETNNKVKFQLRMKKDQLRIERATFS